MKKVKLVAESKKLVEFWLYGVDVNQHTNSKENKGKFIVVHVQRDTRGNRNYVEYICNTPREVLVLVTTLKTFASPIEINNYLIYYTDGVNETNYSLEDIEKAINNSAESSPGTLPPL